MGKRARFETYEELVEHRKKRHAETKELWEKTLEEYALEKGARPAWVKAGYGETYRSHKTAVERALREGKPVPPEVLADYPDLQRGGNPGFKIAPKELVEAVGHWKPAGRIYSHALELEKQGMELTEAIEVAMREPKNWQGFEHLK